MLSSPAAWSIHSILKAGGFTAFSDKLCFLVGYFFGIMESEKQIAHPSLLRKDQLKGTVMNLKLSEKQLFMLKDVARFNYKKYPYRAMPAMEIEIRDFRIMSALLRKELVEYPAVLDHLGFPDMRIDCIRITEKGITVLKQCKK